jgi:two-component system chemotaxis response regulator CheY
MEDKLISSLKIEGVSTLSLSSVLVAVGKERGSVSIVSVIGGKLLLNLNIFKTKIKKIEFYNENIVFCQTDNSIRAIDIVEKKIVFKFVNESVISTFLIADNKIFITDVKGWLKIYDIKTNKLLNEFDLKLLIEKIEYKEGDLILKSRYSLDIFDIKNLKQINIDKEIEFIDFDVNENEIIAVDGKFDILTYLTTDIKENDDKIKEENIEQKGDKVKFLTVDDSSTMRMIIKNSILNHFENVELYEAEDGRKCLEVLRKHPDIDVIFMDWNMPILNGADTVDKIREHPEYDHIKIIMATTEGAKEKVRSMISKGVKGYLVKPFKPDSVIPVAQAMIDKVKEEREQNV